MSCRCREFDYGRLFTSRDCRLLGGNNAVHIFKDYPLNRLIPLLGMSMRTRPQDPINTVIGANSMSAFLSKMSALPPEADMCDAKTYVRFVPKADIRAAKHYVRFTSRKRRVGSRGSFVKLHDSDSYCNWFVHSFLRHFL
jgi:hypothetical protein